MKIMIEVSGRVVTGVTATGDCEIYLVDHDDIDERGCNAQNNIVEVMHPDCVTCEIDLDETPEFDKLLKEVMKITDPIVNKAEGKP